MNLKDLLKKYKGKSIMSMVSFKIPEHEKELIENIASEHNISRSKICRIAVSEFLFQIFGEPKYIEEMRCPMCESKTIVKLNEGDKSAKGKAIYRCANDHHFVYKSLKYNNQKLIKEFMENENE